MLVFFLLYYKYTKVSVSNEFTPIQVPLDHLCPPQAHLGNWPTPPQNSIPAPPFSPCQPANSLASLKPLADSSADLTASPMERSSREQVPEMTCSSGSDEAEYHPVKKTVKRKKKQARKIPELTDDEEEVGKGGERPKSKPASCHLYSKPPALSRGLTKEKVPNLAKEEIPTLAKEEIPNLTKEEVPTLAKEEIPILAKEEVPTLTKEEVPTLTKEEVLNLAKVRQKPLSLTDDSSDEGEEVDVRPRRVNFCGSMRGGAGLSLKEILSMIDLIRLAILGHQPPLKLDQLTPGEGNCFSHGIVQQCQRAPVKIYLQSRGVTISDFMQLKQNVDQFVQTNCKTKKLQDLRINFLVSQRNMHYEGLQARTWKQYWADMKRSGPWADDIFVQCTAWYLGVDLCIIYAGSETGGRTSTTILGDFSPAAEERRPVLYLGYVVNNHYQSLLPQVEDNTVPEWLAQPAIDNTLQDVIRRLDEEQANFEQGSQVGFKKD